MRLGMVSMTLAVVHKNNHRSITICRGRASNNVHCSHERESLLKQQASMLCSCMHTELVRSITPVSLAWAVTAPLPFFSGARKMRSKYPAGVHMLKLPPHLALPKHPHPQQQPAASSASVATPVVNAYEGSRMTSAVSAAACVDGPQLERQHVTPQQLLSDHSTVRCSLPESSGQHLQNEATNKPINDRHNQQQHCSGSESAKDGSSRDSYARSIQVTAASSQASHSLFRPLRKYHGNATENGRVCTLEAVAAALLALEGDVSMYEGLLYNLMLKVDAMRRQKHVGEVYGTGAVVVTAGDV